MVLFNKNLANLKIFFEISFHVLKVSENVIAGSDHIGFIKYAVRCKARHFQNNIYECKNF